MKAYTANLINAATLILCGALGFLSIGGASWTALIPAVFGVALLLCHPGVKAESKLVAHIAVSLTLVMLIALYMPLSSALQNGATGALLRALAMAVTGIIAMVYFIKSFRDARRARDAGA